MTVEGKPANIEGLCFLATVYISTCCGNNCEHRAVVYSFYLVQGFHTKETDVAQPRAVVPVQ